MVNVDLLKVLFTMRSLAVQVRFKFILTVLLIIKSYKRKAVTVSKKSQAVSKMCGKFIEILCALFIKKIVA